MLLIVQVDSISHFYSYDYVELKAPKIMRQSQCLSANVGVSDTQPRNHLQLLNCSIKLCSSTGSGPHSTTDAFTVLHLFSLVSTTDPAVAGR